MFTGIIKAMGRIEGLEKREGDVRLSVRADGLPWSEYDIGESIAVNGVCLTAVALHGDGFDTDVSVETLDVTALGALEPGSAVNLEPSISLGERLGGHLVSGHVDCTGKVLARDTDARSIRLAIEIPQEYARYVAKKGSVCVDGVSLTVNEVSGNIFELNIIPHTAEVTIMGDYVEGTVVNIEVDLLARYLERLIDQDGDGLSLEFLKAHGYA
ncbi:MAG: riboflavin synthase [Gammaproteobacteria bacterium]|nr:riboflavin synthase [Gammaproteobacteria bacterium]NNF50134.1 riboflavin synthase [Woeseiaceae bacterium]MBT8093479.1 riboflavin synthase [Gammaproteobacteria bacterium]MBT8105139.1 riboflavin synthase [Gammaproteobacteria bacterium]NNK25153.1 riboflavin synthase [Woeseiaceae bacterium]